jgi:hypothetical protein
MQESVGYFMQCVDQNVDQIYQRKRRLGLLFPPPFASQSLTNFSLLRDCFLLPFVA